MERKKYYWLKLRADFFTSKRIKKLRNMAGGDTYVIIYLKMQLLAMKTDGVLRWTGLEDKFADELALDLDEKPDDVEVTLMYLLRTGLAETSDNINFFLPYAVENTGKESSSAERVRAFRAREKEVKALQCNTDVTACNTEKEIEIDKEIEKESDIEKDGLTNPDGFVCRTKDVRRIIEAWNSLGLQQVTKITGDSKRGGMLRARVKEYGVDAVLDAIEKVRASAFLQGQNSRNFVITFEWFVKPNNFPKVLEGNYDEHEGTRRKSKTEEYIASMRNENHKHSKMEMDKLVSALDKI